jgi:thiamine kinase-like enzyme
MSHLITDLEQVTPEWLTTVLQEQGSLEQGIVVAVETSSQSLKTSTVSQLKISYSDDAPASAPGRLFFKLSDPDIRSNLYSSHAKEVEFYTKIAPTQIEPLVVRCYDAFYSPELDRAHLLLEDPSDTHYHISGGLTPRPSEYEQAIDCLAKLHASYWEHPRLGQDLGPPLNVQMFIQAFAMWLPGFLDFAGDRLFGYERQLYEKAIVALPSLWERHLQWRLAEGKNLTLIHTDIHFNNFLFPNDPQHDTTRIIDWQSWGVYIGAHDLAYAIALGWPQRRRRVIEQNLVRRYYDGLQKYGVANYDWDSCWFDYRLSLIVSLFTPVLRWALFDESKTGWWWGTVDDTMSAFEDLNCAELLD